MNEMEPFGFVKSAWDKMSHIRSMRAIAENDRIQTVRLAREWLSDQIKDLGLKSCLMAYNYEVRDCFGTISTDITFKKVATEFINDIIDFHAKHPNLEQLGDFTGHIETLRNMVDNVRLSELYVYAAQYINSYQLKRLNALPSWIYKGTIETAVLMGLFIERIQILDLPVDMLN